MADFEHAQSILSTEQINYINDDTNYVITETVVGFTPRDLDKLIECYGDNSGHIRTYNHYFDTTQVMHETQLILKAVNNESDMSQYGWTRILKACVNIEDAIVINRLVSNVTLVRHSDNDLKEVARYAKVIFTVKEEDAEHLNRGIDLVKRHLIRSGKVTNYLGGDGRDSLCHFTTNKNAAFLYRYRIKGLNLNYATCSIKEIKSLKQLGIFFANNFSELIPKQWEFLAVFDSFKKVFKINLLELSTNVRIENLDDNVRSFAPKNLTINGLPCGLDLRITRLGTLKCASNPQLLIKNDEQISDFQQKINEIKIHKPVINEIHSQALKNNKWQISKPLLVNAMVRIFNYKGNKMVPEDTIKYAINRRIWLESNGMIKFSQQIDENEHKMDEDNDFDQIDINHNNNNAQISALHFGGPHSNMGRQNN